MNNTLLVDDCGVLNLAKLRAGNRIKLIQMGADPDPVPPGTIGTVTGTCWLPGLEELQIHVKWDNGRFLSCICPPDIITLATKHEHGGVYEFRWQPPAKSD